VADRGIFPAVNSDKNKGTELIYGGYYGQGYDTVV
jgi:hypothetical protein